MRTKFEFNSFEFDADRLSLTHEGKPVEIERKPLEVLAVLMASPSEVIPYEQIISSVWGDNPHGVTQMHLAQSVSKLRKAFAACGDDTLIIETVRGRGLVFHPAVRQVSEKTNEIADQDADAPAANGNMEPKRRSWNRQRVSVGAVALLLILGVAGIASWRYKSYNNDREEIARVLEESQKYESLVAYRDPQNIDESKLAEFWLTEQEYGAEVDLRRIRAGIDRLSRENKFYGPESKCEQFEIQAIEVSKEGDYATAKTLEKWFLAEYLRDGTLFRNKTVGPYFVHYALRKVDGKWKVEKSSTARAVKPPPIIDSIEFVSEPAAGREFFIRLAGQSIAPDHVFLKVIGPGCPDTNPCAVPNSALRLYSKISETEIARVPLTLAPGEFTIYAQNGESNPSNSVTLTVP